MCQPPQPAYPAAPAAPPSPWASSAPTIGVPLLDVSPRRVEPVPPTESASVQVLRGLLRQREAEMARIADVKADRTRQAEEAEARVAMLRECIDDDNRHIAACDEAITAIQADIAKLLD